MKTVKNVSEISNSNNQVHVLGYGLGKFIGCVCNSKPMSYRIEFESGNVLDFHPTKLQSKLI